jgi:poly(hydroxyalkanoate) depolymerase family esterase
MQTQALSSAVTPELLNLDALGQGKFRMDWYRDALPHRPYWVYIPVNYQVGTPVPLIMILHGCVQPLWSHPRAIAFDTHMNQLADTHQFLVVYPHAFFSPIACWNFFLSVNQHRDSGDPAILAGMVQDMLHNTSRWTIDPARIYVAGISSGGGATANQGATYPDLFAAIGIHSGGEYGYPTPIGPFAEEAQAQDVVEPVIEMEGMTDEIETIAAIPPGPDPIQQGKKAFDAMGRFARVVPTIVFHGTDDHVSNPINGDQATQQWLTTNQLASNGTFKADFKHPISMPGQVPGGRSYTVDTWQDVHSRDVVTYWKIQGMNHKWSGGTPGSIFTDPSAPDASKAIYEFFIAHPHPQPPGALMPVSIRAEEMVSVTTTQVTPTSLTVVKASPGRLYRVLVTTANGENAINIFDNASAATGTIIGVVAANASVGTIYDLQMPAANGITIAGTASAGTITVSYS